jgi:hypothetical protein
VDSIWRAKGRTLLLKPKVTFPNQTIIFEWCADWLGVEVGADTKRKEKTMCLEYRSSIAGSCKHNSKNRKRKN